MDKSVEARLGNQRVSDDIVPVLDRGYIDDLRKIDESGDTVEISLLQIRDQLDYVLSVNRGLKQYFACCKESELL